MRSPPQPTSGSAARPGDGLDHFEHDWKTHRNKPNHLWPARVSRPRTGSCSLGRHGSNCPAAPSAGTSTGLPEPPNHRRPGTGRCP
jgi:hypothetical protein